MIPVSNIQITATRDKLMANWEQLHCVDHYIMKLEKVGPLEMIQESTALLDLRERWQKDQYCHSPTQPQLELVLDLIMGRKPPTTPPPPPGTFKALPGNLGS